VPAASGHRARKPGEDGARIIARSCAHDCKRNDCGEKRRERDTRENETIGVDAAAPSRKRRDENCRSKARDETGERSDRCSRSGQYRDCDRRRRRRADAGEIRIDQRIAEHPLKDRAAERERGADSCSDADARQAQLPNDRVEDAWSVRMCERGRDLPDRERRRADEQACRSRDQREREEADKLDDAAQRLRTSTPNERPGIG